MSGFYEGIRNTNTIHAFALSDISAPCSAPPADTAVTFCVFHHFKLCLFFLLFCILSFKSDFLRQISFLSFCVFSSLETSFLEGVNI